MLHILLVENEFEICSILQRTLSIEFDANIATSQNARGALDYISKAGFVDLIIVRDTIGNENTAKSLVNYLFENKNDTQVLVLGDLQLTGPKFHTLAIPYGIDEFISKLISIFRTHEISFKEALLPQYLPFSLKYFKIIETVNCDIYIKMTKNGEEKYLKRINKGDDLSGHNISEYEENPLINELFIHKDNRMIFYNNILSNALKIITPTKKKKAHSKFKNHSNVYDTVQEVIKDFDIEEDTVNLTNKMTKEMTKTIMGSDKVFDIIKHVISNPGSFTYKHSYLTAVFSYEILRRVDFINDEDHLHISFEKLVWVCFFHDIYLTNEDHQKITNKIDFFKAKLDSKDKEIVSGHANRAATLVQQFRLSPSGVDTIIKQHHGTSNGIGFTDFYKSNISPLAVIFIVAEEFVVKVLDFNNRQQTVPEIIDELTIKFELPTYRKVLDALKSLLDPNK